MFFGWPKRFDVTGGLASQEIYLTRWVLFSIRGWNLRLHLFRKTDRDSCFHDHPWRFWTLILRGGYVEETPEGRNQLRPGLLRARPASYRHRLVSLPKGRAWTLILTAPKEQSWGFWTRGGKAFTPWREFVNTPFLDRVGWCAQTSTDAHVNSFEHRDPDNSAW